MSELALQRIHEAKQHRLTRLDLGNCGLTELPDELFELTWLEELILNEDHLEYDFETKLKYEANNIKFINPQIKKLKELKKLLIGSNFGAFELELHDLFPLKYLTKLEKLGIQCTQVSDLKPLEHLALLRDVEINDTKISDLTPLKNLKLLQTLVISATQVSDISPLKDLTRLQNLYIYDTLISDLSPLSNLIKLQLLWVNDTKVNDLNPLKGLIQLQEIDISNTSVRDLYPLKDLIKLKRLDILGTQVNDLNPLKDLINLKKLEICLTQVSDLTPLKNIIAKGVRVKWAKHEKGIMVEDCPLINPPKEIVEQGNKAILTYWEQIEKQKGTVELYEAKLIIVGEGGTGKTTLYEKLKNPTHQVGNTPETHGINIHEGLEIRHAAIDNQLFHANLWDFGGQELQYMTHQFFLTPRALYVLMMDARKEAPNLAYWLKIISLLGKDSQDSTEKVRLLLVFNKRQNSTGTPPQYQDTLQYYQDHLDVQYLEVDFGENDKRFENLKDTIERSLVTLPIVKSQLPRKWKDVREDLRQEAKTRTHISTERLAEICSKHSITDEQDQLQLSDYLHKLGSLLHFQNDKTLINWVFLSPEWVVEGVYGFLKNDLIARQNGKFTEDDFFKILSTTKNDKNYTYTRPDSAKILQLMTKNNFDICYESANSNYVAAQLLPENAPPQYKWSTHSGALKFRYQYPVMPKGLMSRLIVRLSEYLEIMDGVEVVWKKGAILSIKTDKNDPKSVSRILMKEDDAESKDGLRQIIFEVMGYPESHRKHALQRVREEVESLHKRWFRSIKADEMVPCCCTVCQNSTTPELYKLEKLLKLREKRAETVCYSSGEDIAIFHLLEGVYEESEIKNMGARGGFREYGG